MSKQFKILSSDKETIYIVEFVNDENKLMVFCNCPAGIFGKFCKHKMGLLTGNLENLADPSELDGYQEVKGWIQQSNLPQMIDQMASSEKELEKIKAQLNSFKKKIELALKDGVDLKR